MCAERSGGGKEEEAKATSQVAAAIRNPSASLTGHHVQQKQQTNWLLQQAFDAYHRYLPHDQKQDQQHFVSASALQKILADNGVPMREGDLQRILGAVAIGPGRDSLNFEQFYHIFVGLKIFHSFDKRERGSIHREELRKALRSVSLNPGEDRLDDMLAMTEPAHPSRLTFPEFLEIYAEAQREDDPHRIERYLHHALSYWYTGAGVPLRGGMMPTTQQLTPLQDFLAGTVAGIAITLVGHPFDTIKVRMQMGRFPKATDAIKATIRKEGIRAFFKGMGSPMASIPLVNAIVFAAYGQAKSFLRDSDNPDEPLNLWQLALAGSWAGFVNSFVVSPVELVKTRLQIQYNAPTSFFARSTEGNTLRGPLDVIRRIVREKGILGLGKGISATIYREMPAYAGQFMVYELVKRWLVSFHHTNTYQANGDDLHPLELLLAGGMAGIGAWVTSYPMDFIKTKIQAQPDEGAPKYKKHPFLFDGGFVDCLKENVRANGWRVLWKGFGPCVSRAFPANAAGFLAFELAARLLRQRQEEAAASASSS